MDSIGILIFPIEQDKVLDYDHPRIIYTWCLLLVAYACVQENKLKCAILNFSWH